MSYTLRTLQLVLNDDGTIRAARGDYVEIAESGRDVPVGTLRIAAADLEAALPTLANAVATVDALEIERDAVTVERNELENRANEAEGERDAAKATSESLTAKVAELEAERDALTDERIRAAAERDDLAGRLAAAQAEIEALKAQIPPDNVVNGVPQIVSAYQARTALLQAGLLDQVEAAVAASTDRQAQIAWEYATEVHRTSPFIVAIRAGLKLTDAQVDALFIAAGQVT